MDWPDYVRKCREIALCELALRPWEFYVLTPREFEDMCRGHTKREHREWEKLAWLSANIMSMWSKRRITVKQLLGPGYLEDVEGQDVNAINIKEEMERIAVQNKKKFWTQLSDKYAKKEVKDG